MLYEYLIKNLYSGRTDFYRRYSDFGDDRRKSQISFEKSMQTAEQYADLSREYTIFQRQVFWVKSCLFLRKKETA